jgi:hypothetical protein
MATTRAKPLFDAYFTFSTSTPAGDGADSIEQPSIFDLSPLAKRILALLLRTLEGKTFLSGLLGAVWRALESVSVLGLYYALTFYDAFFVWSSFDGADSIEQPSILDLSPLAKRILAFSLRTSELTMVESARLETASCVLESVSVFGSYVTWSFYDARFACPSSDGTDSIEQSSIFYLSPLALRILALPLRFSAMTTAESARLETALWQLPTTSAETGCLPGLDFCHYVMRFQAGMGGVGAGDCCKYARAGHGGAEEETVLPFW